ncbi:uncharacterized protein Dwil_GK15954 [Drosophila willistoni]|uniref:Glutathione transferase n=1 Tax=Drosophila willistoni TaxID=7260 RepID=B4MS66_DROWI|nr:glutathione S-transferase theta-1 [Drosophila willistoni]EDW74955.1 uncharacterized protein Dwil_GK15954 [Drosophila willistoni]
MANSLKFYYDFLSQPSRVLWMSLKLSKTPFEACPVALRKREQLTDEYKKINRFQKVPSLVDNDFHLSESVAMVRYLAAKGQLSEQLYPKALKDRARIDEYLEWQHSNVRLPCGQYFRDAWLYPANGIKGKPKPEEVDKMIKAVNVSLGSLERFWLDKEFLIGSNLTIADLFGAAEINQIKLCQYNVNEQQFPKVAKWLDRVRESSNPYFDEAHQFIYKNSQQAVKAKI